MSGHEAPLARREFRHFVEREILPHAERHDREEQVSKQAIAALADAGYLGALVSQDFGGLGMDMITFGALNEELGRGCSSIRSLITVQSMVARVVERWGSEAQKSRWLGRLAQGSAIGAFALTEPDHGSDAAGIETAIATEREVLRITGRKKWVSFGQIADLIVTFGRQNDKLCAVMIERDRSGLSALPIRGMLGLRGAMLAELVFEDCPVPKENLLGSAGFGLFPVAFTGLDIGRYSIAWGCVGQAEAALQASVVYANTRRQFGAHLCDHQLIQRLLTDMMVDIRAARLLCLEAGRLGETGDRTFFREMLVAKYYAARMVNRVTAKAVELHGANGLSREFSVERLYRDAKVMETVEGSNQMMQILISKYGLKP